MASKPKAKPVASTGIDVALLTKIYNEGGLHLTQAEGKPLVDAGLARVDTSNVDGNKALVMLTEAGANIVIANNPKTDEGQKETATQKAKPNMNIRTDIPVPEIKRAGRKTAKYDFDGLSVNASFHLDIPNGKTADEALSAIASSLTAARNRYAVGVKDENGQPVMETVKSKTYQTSADGKRVKGPDGKYIVASTEDVTRQKMQTVRNFVAAIVGADDPDGAGIRVWRSK